MRTYEERLANIRAKADANKKAKHAIAATAVTLSVFVLLIGSVILWPEMLFGQRFAPTMGPALQQPSLNDAPTVNTTPSQPNEVEPAPASPTVPAPTEPDAMEPGSPEDAIGFQVYTSKLHAGENFDFAPFVIQSVEELALFYTTAMEQLNWTISSWSPFEFIHDGLYNSGKYNDDFFAKKSMIVLKSVESSGSNQLEVTDVFTAGDSVCVTIDRILPEAGTCDMAYWYVFIETEAVLPEGTVVDVMYRINGDTWQEPASEWSKITISTETIYYGAPDMDAKYPRVAVISSVEELQKYLSHLEQDLSAETHGYDAAFFEKYTLLALWNPVGSSSEDYRVTEVWRMSDGGISIHCQKTVPEVCDDDIMSWLIFIKSAEDISRYAKITVEYETIEAAVPPERPEETNLEFWIGEDVAHVDFSAYDEIYGWFGAREFLGKGYRSSVSDDGQQIYPATYVSYLVGAFPDEADGGSFVTSIEIRDSKVTVYGLTIQSDEEQFDAVFRAMGYWIYEKGGIWYAEKNGIIFTFRQGEYMRIRAEVTNREGIIY